MAHRDPTTTHPESPAQERPAPVEPDVDRSVVPPAHGLAPAQYRRRTERELFRRLIHRTDFVIGGHRAEHFLPAAVVGVILSAVLFGLGVFAFIFKRNVITIFMSIELMLNAVNLAFVAFSQALGKLDGQVFVLFVIVVAAAEAAVGLGIIILIARNRQTLNVERVDLLKL